MSLDILTLLSWLSFDSLDNGDDVVSWLIKDYKEIKEDKDFKGVTFFCTEYNLYTDLVFQEQKSVTVLGIRTLRSVRTIRRSRV